MKLRELLDYEDIVIQCHDNPDADALASAFGVHRYLAMHGRQASIIYGGPWKTLKPNLRLMEETFGVPVNHVDAFYKPQLLVMVDCQYDCGNATCFEAEHVAVIDHHEVSTQLPPLSEVRSNLGSCSTLVWQMLKDEGVDVNADPKLATALYYGLYIDTNAFSEIVHPLDRDLRDEAAFSPELMAHYRNCNLSMEELETVGTALLKCAYNEKYRFAVVRAGNCEPNVLGVISDFVLEVDVVDLCLVFSMNADGVKFSVRSCVKEARANEIADELSRGMGSGGGHLGKGGGFIRMDALCEAYLEACRCHNLAPRLELSEDDMTQHPSPSAIQSFFMRRMIEYFDHCKVVYADTYQLTGEGIAEYERMPLPSGYVRLCELMPVGTEATLRTMEGDLELTITEEMVLLIGIQGEVNLLDAARFAKDYVTFDRPYALDYEEYIPTIREEVTGRVVTLLHHAKICFPSRRQIARAQQLDGNTKVFTGHSETYILGRPGDYLVEHWDGAPGVPLLPMAIFHRMYQKATIKSAGVQAVVFDMDGTLLDTLDDLMVAVNHALAMYGLPERTRDEVRQFVGNGAHWLIECAVPNGLKNPHYEQVYEEFQRYYAVHCNEQTHAYPGILELLDVLEDKGIAMAVVSNKPDGAVKELAKRYFADSIPYAFGDDGKRERKPAPDTVLAVMEAMGAQPERTIYIGDSDVDIRTAANAGLPCISVTWGFRDPEFLVANGATRLIHRPEGLLDYL